METDYDQHKRRCPRLGGPVSFGYCRSCGADQLPCWKAVDCWWEIFDVAACLKSCYGETVLERMAQGKPQQKISQLIELIAQAQGCNR